MSQTATSTVTERQAEEAYHGFLDHVERRAEEHAEADDESDGARASHIREAVSDRFEEIDAGDVAFFTSVLVQSEHGPHDNWQKQRFDTDDPQGALRALAGSAITSDIIARR